MTDRIRDAAFEIEWHCAFVGKCGLALQRKVNHAHSVIRGRGSTLCSCLDRARIPLYFRGCMWLSWGISITRAGAVHELQRMQFWRPRVSHRWELSQFDQTHNAARYHHDIYPFMLSDCSLDCCRMQNSCLEPQQARMSTVTQQQSTPDPAQSQTLPWCGPNSSEYR